MDSIQTNAAFLKKELKWLKSVINTRVDISIRAKKNTNQTMATLTPPDASQDPSPYAETIRKFKVSFEERIVLILALSVYIRPGLIMILFSQDEKENKEYVELGGIQGIDHKGILPTIQTALFILAGNDIEKRVAVMHLFDEDHFFSKANILCYQVARNDEPSISNRLMVSEEYRTLLIRGKPYKPTFSAQFPASLITTPLEWKDLVLDYETAQGTEKVKKWIKHRSALLRKRYYNTKLPGYRILLSGPLGVGKTFTATLLGKATSMDVYKVNLAMIVSKYIGETEKNLARLFQQSENKNWILFFDEADALFGQRTVIEYAHDLYVNQEVTYLLRRIEDFSGIIILATNLKENIDEAFLRRLHAIIEFPKLDAEQRLLLWQKAFEGPIGLHKGVDLAQIAHDYEGITGELTLNVLRYCLIQAMERPSRLIMHEDILIGIEKEFRKEGRSIF